MKTKLINTGTYLFLISDSVIEPNDWVLLDWGGEDYRWGKCISSEEGSIHIYNQFGTNESKCDKERYPEAYWGKIVAYYALKEAKKLDLPLLPNPFEELDLEELSNLFIENDNNTPDILFIKKQAFIEGYKAAQAKQFSLEEMNIAIEMAREGNFSNYEHFGYVDWDNTEDKIIQSLSTQQLPKEFIPEYEKYCSTGRKCDSKGSNCKSAILKPKTTNSEGKETIVGTYKY